MFRRVLSLAILITGCVPQLPPPKQPALSDEELTAKRAVPYKEGLSLLAKLDATCQTKEIDLRVDSLRTSFVNTRNLERELGEPELINSDEYRQFHTDLSFRLADKALALGCLDTADSTYRGLIEFYVGNAYQGIRDRAKVGIDDVRAKRH